MATKINPTQIDWDEVATGTIASGANLGLDSNDILVKASVSGGGGISFDGSTANGVLTYKDSDEATVESNMTFDGNTLTISGDVSNNYVLIVDNDQSSAGHGLKVTTDGTSTGTYVLELESASSSLLRVRADGSVGIGATTMGQKLTVEGDIGVASDLVHKGDSDTKIAFTTDDISIQAGGVEFVKITEDDSQDVITINDSGADIDFVVESPNESKALYLHAGNEVFHINHGESDFQTKIHNTNDLALTVNSTGVVLNDDGHATNDFRVESDNNTHMLFVDAGSDKIGINDSDPISELSVAGKISITSESSTPSAPADGHGWLYTKSDGKIYWQSNDVAETDLTGGGASSSDTFIMFQQIEQVNNLSTSYYYYKIVTGGYGWTNSFSPSNFSTSFPYWRIHRYASSGTVPVDCSMTKYRIAGHKDGTDNDTITLKIWRVPAATHGDSETDIPTLVEVVSVEINADGNEIINKNAAVSSNNSFTAGDSWFVTLAPTSSYMTSDHYMQLSVEFTVS